MQALKSVPNINSLPLPSLTPGQGPLGGGGKLCLVLLPERERVERLLESCLGVSGTGDMPKQPKAPQAALVFAGLTC